MTPQQFEQHTQSLYRLRSARNKRRSVIEDRDKQLRKLDKAHTEAYYAFHRRAWVDLDEPYQRGWYRHFELTESTATHRQAAMYAGILACINTVQRSYRKDFTKVKREQGRKLRFDVEQHLSGLTSYAWKKSGLGHTEAALFDWNPGFDRQGRFRYKLVFTQPWRYELKVRPRMITQVQQVDPELQSRLKRLENRFEQCHLGPRRDKIVRGRAWRYNWKDSTSPQHRDKLEFRRIPLHRLLSDTAESNH